MTTRAVLAVTVGLSGLLLAVALTRGRPRLAELGALTAALALLLGPALGVLLALLGVFGVPGLLLSLCVASVWPAALAARRGWLARAWRSLRDDLSTNTCDHVALAAILVLAGVLAGRPSEWVLSEHMDAGNYFIQAAYQASHPTLFLEGSQPEAYAADFPRGQWQLNSTSGQSLDGVRRALPFPPLFRFQLALALLAGGEPAARCLPLLLGLGAVLCAYVALRGLAAGTPAALTGAALLALSPVLVQFVRVPLAGISALNLLLAGLALLAVAHERRSRPAAAAAGVVLGVAMLARVDGLLVYAGGLVAVAAGLPEDERMRRTFAPAFLITSVASWLLARHATPHYLDAHLPGDLGGVTLFVAGSATALLAAGFGPSRWTESISGLVRRGLAAALAVTAGVGAWALLGRPLSEARRVLEYADAALWGAASGGAPASLLGLAFLGVPTVVGGVAGLWLAALRRQPSVFTWAALTMFGAVLYFDDLRHMPGAYWASRRYLPFALPLLVVGAVVATEWLQERLARGGSGRAPRAATVRWALVGVAAATLLAQNALLTYGNGRHYLGASAGLAGVAARFPRRDVVLIDGHAQMAAALQLGLRHLHGREALSPVLDTLRDDELLAFWRKQAGARRGLHLVTGEGGALHRIERLFEVECAPLALEYRHEARGTPELHVLRWTACRVRGTRAARPARGQDRVRPNS